MKTKIVSIVMALLAALSVFALNTSAHAVTTNPVPVVEVHGYSGAPTQGLNTRGYWGYPTYMLKSHGFANVYTLSYYKNDSNGVDVTQAGPGTGCSLATSTATVAGFDHGDSIESIAYRVAWCLYDAFGTQQIDLVGHSMGGLIIRYALQQITEGNPDYPPALNVGVVISFSSPFGGAYLGCKDTQCNEMLPDSAFLTSLYRGAVPNVPWYAIGSGVTPSKSYCDIVHSPSAVQAPGSVGIIYANPCYQHLGYLGDLSTQPTATTTIGDVQGRHSLYEMLWLLEN
jgi:triacylglycerol esterase/lipase EstA (alpha/beta hydrolase family)